MRGEVHFLRAENQRMHGDCMKLRNENLHLAGGRHNPQWTEHHNPQDGSVYFYNMQTQESIWERPADYNPPHMPPQMPLGPPMGMAGPGMGMPPMAGAPGGGTPMNTAAPTPDGQQRKGPPGANLFVVKIPDDYGNKDLFDTFTPFGNVIRCQITTDKVTGESKGFGFVSYDTPQEADAAVENMNGAMVGDRRLKVEKSREQTPY